MTKEEFKTLLIEQQVFDELKDGYFGGISYIRLKYEGSGIDFNRVYRRIVNYRIATYGTSTLFNPGSWVYKNKETRKKESHNAYMRNKYRRNNERD